MPDPRPGVRGGRDPGAGARAGARRPGRDSNRPAGVVSRGVAAVLDLAVVAMVLAGAYLGAVLVRLLLALRDFRWPAANTFFTVTAFIAVSILYLAGCWSVSGRTIGSVVMGLRVVSERGRSPSFPVALVRALLCVFFAVGLLWAAVDRRRRSVADLLLRTRVVYSH